jgi:mono/diheme cytochrome c family protein
VTPPPAPATVTPDEAAAFPVVVSVPTAGLAERVASSVPRWLAAVFIILPAIGLLYLAGSGSASECTEGGIGLAVDPVTGQAVNCDGSEFEGRGEPGGGTDFVALGEQLYAGAVVSGVNCAGCHGANGGGGVGPGFGGVNLAFSSCADHIEWVDLGTSGFQAAGRTTYGDLNKPVGGGGNMPGFQASLTPEQLAAVVAYERIRFGGGNEDEVLADCGLVTPEGEGDGTGDGTETSVPAGEATAPTG